VLSTLKGEKLDDWGSIPGKSKCFFFAIKIRQALVQPSVQWINRQKSEASAEIKMHGVLYPLPNTFYNAYFNFLLRKITKN
jgi:hypothetical protein